MKEKLDFGSLGNGVTVWDCNKMEHGDTKIVSQINRDRKTSYYAKDLSVSVKKAIKNFARKKNIRMSTSQPEFVMLKPLGVTTGNYQLLLINRKDKSLNLSFKKKPSSHIRNHLRLIGFSWSRKNKYWRSYLNKTQIRRVRKFYRNIN